MGTVYLAEHTLIRRRVAIKVLHHSLVRDPDAVRRFMLEARAAATLGHPNIVASTDMGFLETGVPYIVMEYLEGATLLDEIIRVGAFSPRRTLRVAAQIASALEVAHDAGIVHRDLKAENIFLTDGEIGSDHVKVLDFGISKFMEAASTGITRGGVVMGTPEYMAPEQISSPELVDGRADIYSLGILIYQMLTRFPPFHGGEMQGLLLRVLTAEIPPIERNDVPPKLVALIHSLLSRLPADRPQTMRDVLLAMDDVLVVAEASSHPVSTPSARVVASPHPPAHPRRSAGRWVALASVMAAATAGTYLSIVGSDSDHPPPPSDQLSVSAGGPDAQQAPPASATPELAIIQQPSKPIVHEIEMTGTDVVDEVRSAEPPSGARPGRRIRPETPVPQPPVPTPRKDLTEPKPDGNEKPGGEGEETTPRVAGVGSGDADVAAPKPPATPMPMPRLAPPVTVVTRRPGELDPREVRLAVERQLGSVRDCYDRGRMDKPDLAGKVVVVIGVSSTGTVSSTRIASSSLRQPAIERCVADAIRTWRFPIPAGGVSATISYPFNFK